MPLRSAESKGREPEMSAAGSCPAVPAGCCVLPRCALQVLYEDCRMVAVSAPYVAGFLAFREVPFMVEAVQRLQREQPELRPQVRHVPLPQVGSESCCGCTV